jgi:hypothetical protein
MVVHFRGILWFLGSLWLDALSLDRGTRSKIF